MNKHAVMPRLCPECEGAAWKLAENPQQLHVFQPCIHTGSLAIALKSGTSIRSWEISGPMSLEAMKHMMKAILASLDSTDQAAADAAGSKN